MIWTSIWADNKPTNDTILLCALRPPSSLSFTMLCGGSGLLWALVITQYFKSHFCPLLAPLLLISSNKDGMCAEGDGPSLLLPTYCEPLDTHKGDSGALGGGKWRGGEDDLIISQLDSPAVHLCPPFNPHPPTPTSNPPPTDENEALLSGSH